MHANNLYECAARTMRACVCVCLCQCTLHILCATVMHTCAGALLEVEAMLTRAPQENKQLHF